MFFHAYSRQEVSILQPVSHIRSTVCFYKVLLKNSCAHWFMCCLWLLLNYKGRDENIYYLFFYRNLPNPVLDSNNLSFYSAQKACHTYNFIYFRKTSQWMSIFHHPQYRSVTMFPTLQNEEAAAQGVNGLGTEQQKGPQTQHCFHPTVPPLSLQEQYPNVT